MPRRNALHHHRPAVRPASRLLSCYPSHNQPPLPPDADWCGAAQALGAGLRLCPTRGVAPLLPRHGAPQGSPLWYKGEDGLRWLGKISASTTEDGVYLARILDDPGPIKLPLFPARYTTSAGAVRGSWCLQVHAASVFSRGVQRNVDYSRGSAVISSLPRRRCARQFSGFLGSPPGSLLVASAYWDLSLLLRFLPAFSAYWDLRFLFGWFLVLSAS